MCDVVKHIIAILHVQLRNAGDAVSYGRTCVLQTAGFDKRPSSSSVAHNTFVLWVHKTCFAPEMGVLFSDKSDSASRVQFEQSGWISEALRHVRHSGKQCQTQC